MLAQDDHCQSVRIFNYTNGVESVAFIKLVIEDDHVLVLKQRAKYQVMCEK